MPTGHARSHRIGRWLGIGVPVVAAAVVFVVVAALRPRLPEDLATHWGPAGPDGFTPVATFSVLGPLIVLLSTLPMSGLVFLLSRGRWSPTHRVLTALIVGVSVFVGAMLLFAVAVQVDLTDAREAPPLPLFVPLLAGVGAGALAHLALPAGVRRVPPRRSAPPLAAAASRVWTARITPGGPLAVLVGVSMLPLVFFTVWLGVSGAEQWWIMVLISFGVALLFAAFLVFRIRVSPAGLEARSVLGWPRFFVPTEEIHTVTVRRIDPLEDFGGWGLRWSPRRIGIVSGDGEGIYIERTGGRVFAVTTAEAGVPVAILTEALASRIDP